MKHIHFSKNIVAMVILMFLMSGIRDLKATHIIGGTMSYKYLGNRDNNKNQYYEITLRLRRDCLKGQAPFDKEAHIGIFRGNGSVADGIGPNGNGFFTISLKEQDVLPPQESDCQIVGINSICVQEALYVDTIQLPYDSTQFRRGGFIIAYQRCCRNVIENIVNPLQTGATYFVHITEDVLKSVTNDEQFGNASPRFKNWPDVYICLDKDWAFDHGAIDDDGTDSLVYEFCTPYTGLSIGDPGPRDPERPPFKFIQWNTNFSANNPIVSNPGIKIDPKTGRITAHPEIYQGQFLIGVCVKEYRKINGVPVLISITRRDCQLSIRECVSPPVADFNTKDPDCSGLTINFDNKSLNGNRYEWNLDNTVVQVNNNNNNFSYTFPNPGVYKVLLKTIRQLDGCFDTITKFINVYENSIKPEIGHELDICDVLSGNYRIKIEDLTQFDFPVDRKKWQIKQGGLDTSFFDVDKFDFNTQITEDIWIRLDVSSTLTGCDTFVIKTISLEEEVPVTDFTYRLQGCPENGTVRLELTDLSDALNPGRTIDSITWRYNNLEISGDAGNTPVFMVFPDTLKQIRIYQYVDFNKSCEIEKFKDIDLQALIPRANYTFEALGCVDNDVIVRLTYLSDLALGEAASSVSWTAGTPGNLSIYNDPIAEFLIPKDSLLEFTLNVRFQNGCEDEIKKSFVPGPFVTLKIIDEPLILCPGDIRPLIKEGNAIWTYTWSPVQGLDLTVPSNPLVTGENNITYYVTITDGLCTLEDSVHVIVLKDDISLTITGNANTCFGEAELTATSSINFGEFEWSTNPAFNPVIATGPVLSTTFGGDQQTFWVRIKGADCASDPAQFTVTNQKLKLDYQDIWTICPGDTIKGLQINNINMAHNVQFSWTENPHISGDLFSGKIDVITNPAEQDSIELFFTAVDANFGCTALGTIVIKFEENPIVDFEFDLVQCGDNTIAFSFSDSYVGNILWNFGDPGTQTDTDDKISTSYTYPGPGKYEVILTNITPKCPFEPVKKEVIIYEPITVKASEDMKICEAQEFSVSGTSNLPEATLSWKNKDGIVLSDQNAFTFNFVKDTTLILMGMDPYGCSNTDTVNISFFIFDFSVDVPAITCEGTEATAQLMINDPSAYTIEWGPGTSIISTANTSALYMVARNVVYTVQVTNNQYGCVKLDTFAFNIPDPIQAELTGNPQCAGNQGPLSLILDNPQDYTVTWQPAPVAGSTSTNPVFIFTEGFEVTAFIINNNTNCRDTLTFSPEVYDNPVINIDVDKEEIFELDTINIFVTDPVTGHSYLWNNGETGNNIVIIPNESGTYTVVVTDQNGCKDTASISLDVRLIECDEDEIFIPNAFSPNGDDANDILFVRSQFIDQLEFVIFNRWGQEVFRTDKFYEGWDGSFKGESLPPDAFAYYIKARCRNGKRYEKAGNVSLMK